ncbi:AEC family transporter [Hominifimenecus sp. rT4P-3]|uniref:AEC family transporter n=1 Tax=Hominifimenecus sp. rT4P-3 TaxID=3242979 RepID=UPI003DA49483
MDYGIVWTNLLILFALIGVGYVAGRFRVVSQDASKDLSSLLMKITLPATIFASFIRSYEPKLLKDAGIILGLGFFFFLLSALLSALLVKPFRVAEGNRGVWMLTSTFSNTGFMGFPIVLALLGEEGLFLACIMNLSFNVLVFSLGIKMICLDSDRKGSIQWKKILISNINISIVLGLFFFLTQISLPAPVMSVINHFGGVTTPLSMFLIGLSLAKGKIGDLFRGKDAFTATFLRLIAMPLVAWLLMRLMPFGEGSFIPGVVLVILAMPAPSVVLILAESYDGNSEMAGRMIFLSSLLCIVTIPLMLLLL